jgi:5-methylcytosine-specific restriction enzyme A
MGRLSRIAPRLAEPAPRLKLPAKLADPFYESTAWRSLALAIKDQRGWQCEACGRDGRKTPRLMIADHIIERKDGGADLDPLNIRVLCAGCHNAKTAKARAERARG